MKFTEISRTATDSGEVLSTYDIGNLTIHLTSRFNDKTNLEDIMYQLALQHLRSQKKLDGRQDIDGNVNKNGV